MYIFVCVYVCVCVCVCMCVCVCVFNKNPRFLNKPYFLMNQYLTFTLRNDASMF